MKVYLKKKLVEVIEIVSGPTDGVEVTIPLTSLGVHLNAQMLNDSSQAYLKSIYPTTPVAFPKEEDNE